MTKAKFERNKPHCNIGTIGHVDHGKTSLTAAITKILAKTGGSTFTPDSQIHKAPEEAGGGFTVSGPPGPGAGGGCVHEQGRHGRVPRAFGPGRARGSRAVEELPVPGRRHTGG